MIIANGRGQDLSRRPWLWPSVVVVAVLACSAYANLSFLVNNPQDYRLFPPFRSEHNRNMNTHLGAEYLNIARSLIDGGEFGNPFAGPTGPTAWMPPLLPSVLAALLWVSGGDIDAVTAVIVWLQDLILIGTGLLVLALARQTTGVRVATLVFLVALLCHFRLSFQFTHDCWLLLLLMDLLIAGLVWLRPLRGSAVRAAVWGAFGGLCALGSPVVGLTWGVLTLACAGRGRKWRFLVAALAAMSVVAPWMARNYDIFGRLIPVKSNLAFELYQSQVLQPSGVLELSSYATHPYKTGNSEGKEYRQLGEIAYLDRKMEQFLNAIRTDPTDFLKRIGERVLAATILYKPFDANGEAEYPWALWLSRLTHSLPFLALLVVLGTRRKLPLGAAEWIVVGAYVVFLLPYVLVSYYERYVFPLLAVKSLLVVWAVDRLDRLRLTMVDGGHTVGVQSADPGPSLPTQLQSTVTGIG
jgi:hypothetical protein